MSQPKQRAVVICPGRGTYNKEELGYLQRLHGDKGPLLEAIDQQRAQQGQVTVSQLDAMDKYQMRVHTAGENAASLIYACSYADFQSIDSQQYDIVAVTGNSMGWYIALAVAGALNTANAAQLINTMGSMMAGGVVGGQSLYPVVDDNWQPCSKRQALVNQVMAEVQAIAGTELYPSIYLGGYLVVGGNELGLKEWQQRLPPVEDRYPMRLFNHAAFHTPLLDDISNQALAQLPESLFQTPTLPLVDGRGGIWQPYSCDLTALYQYTLGEQVNRAYNFSKAVEVSVKEFAPDKLIILGPGATLGGAVAQSLIQQQWQGMSNKADFIARQKGDDPFVLAMGMDGQRQRVVK